MMPFLLFDLVEEPVRNAPIDGVWLFLPFGYLLTILIETPILLVGLSPKLIFKQKLACGFWLTACTYPIVVLVLPILLQNYSRGFYLLLAESFAHFGECFLFWLAFRGRKDFEISDWIRSFAAILLANFASFSIGEVLNYFQWFGLF